jgi:hypothetical protein
VITHFYCFQFLEKFKCDFGSFFETLKGFNDHNDPYDPNKFNPQKNSNQGSIFQKCPI